MDEGPQEKVETPSLETCFQEIHDALLKDETQLETIIRIMPATHEPYISIKALASMIKVLIHNFGLAFDALQVAFEETDFHFEEIKRVNERVAGLRKDLDAHVQATRQTLDAVNLFVERYTPMLEHLAEGRGPGPNAGGSPRQI